VCEPDDQVSTRVHAAADGPAVINANCGNIVNHRVRAWAPRALRKLLGVAADDLYLRTRSVGALTRPCTATLSASVRLCLGAVVSSNAAIGHRDMRSAA